MRDYLKFYINGAWVDPITPKTLDVINPATEGVAGRISLGSAADVDLAVKAARTAFESFSRTSRAERVEPAKEVQPIPRIGQQALLARQILHDLARSLRDQDLRAGAVIDREAMEGF